MCTFSERDCRSPFPEVPVNQRNRCAAANRVRRLLRLTGVSDSFGAGTIIDARNAIAAVRSFVRPPGPRETTRNLGCPTPEDLRPLPGVPNFRCPRSPRPPSVRNRHRCDCTRPSLTTGAFGLLTVPSVTSTHVSSASGHILLGAALFKIEFDVSVDGFPEQGRPMFSWRLVVGRYVRRCAYVTSHGPNISPPNGSPSRNIRRDSIL